MEITKEMIERMSEEELKELAQLVKEELERRKQENSEEFEFYFEASENTAKRKNPYVARLYLVNGELQREFKNLERSYGKKEVTVYGHYTAKAGDIIEKRKGGSWKNEYRYWYLVLPDGKEEVVADINDSKEKKKVISYLKGEITAEELL